MAQISFTIKASGGSYTSLASYVATEAADLVAAGNQHEVECFAFNDINAAAVNWGAFNCDAVNYIRVFATPGAEAIVPPEPVRGVATYVFSSSAANTYFSTTNCNYLRLEHLTFHMSNNASYQTMHTGSLGMRAVGLVFDGNGATADRSAMLNIVAGMDNYWRNCVALNGAANRRMGYKNSAGVVYAYNCTAISLAGLGAGFSRAAGTFIAKNCIADGFAAGSGYTGTFDAASEYNASSDATAPGINALINQTFDWKDAANDDYHLNSALAGVDLSADANFAFSDDLDRVARSNWDRGAFEYVAANGQPLAANDASSDTEAVANTATQTQQLAGVNASAEAEAVADVITQTQQLAGDDANADSEAVADIITQTQQLAGDNASANTEVVPGAVSQGNELTATDISSSTETVADVITQTQQLAGDDANADSEAIANVITQTQQLASDDASANAEVVPAALINGALGEVKNTVLKSVTVLRSLQSATPIRTLRAA